MTTSALTQYNSKATTQPFGQISKEILHSPTKSSAMTVDQGAYR